MSSHPPRFPQAGGAPRRASQRRHRAEIPPKSAPRRHPAAARPPVIFNPGDPVTWNTYRGCVQRVVGDEAVVVEKASPLLGRTLIHVIRLEALTLAP